MSVLNENQLLGASGAGGDYEIEQSLRFNESDITYLSRTFPSAGNLRTWTFSCWLKRGTIGQNSFIFSSSVSGNAVYIDTADILTIEWYNGSANYYKQTLAKLRDPSAWYHIVAVYNTTSGTADDRLQLWLNGERVTSFAGSSNPTQNLDSIINTAIEHNVGQMASGQAHDSGFDGYIGEVNFIDGQALTADSFGETGDYGEWKPIAYAGTYGTNGFYLPFEQDYTVEGFSTVVYEGNGTSQYVGGTGFKPDLVWAKSRSAATSHGIADSVRGVRNILSSNGTAAEYAESAGNTLTDFNTDGFTVGADGNYTAFNQNGSDIVAWSWDMGGTTASNTNGSITSSVRANTAYGQSIVSYSGTGANATIGHGLASAPEVVILKNRDDATKNWNSIFTVLGNNYIDLNRTNATYTGSTYFQNTAPTSTVFSVGTAGSSNASSQDFIAYCFHSVTGYSKFGSYSGNATADNAITTGFAPAFVMIKRTDATGDWMMFDNARNPTQPDGGTVKALFSNTSGVESDTYYGVQFTATGFNLQYNDSSSTNASGATYIYAAFADTREYAYWYDQSGNNNDWTSEGGLTESDVMVDSPTNNFATWNPLDSYLTPVLSEGNLKIQLTNARCRGTIASQSDGKIYFEVYNPTLVSNTNVHHMGLGSISLDINNASNMETASGGGAVVFTYANANARTISARQNGSTVATVTLPNQIAAGDIIAFASDSSTGKVWMSQNNSWLKANGSFDGTNALSDSNYLFQLATGHELAPLTMPLGATPSTIGVLNCGQDSSFAGAKTAQGNSDSNGIGDFYYAPPTGFLALCTANLPSVDVIPSENFNPVLWTGNGANGRDITNIGFTPDFVWIKSRSLGSSHLLNDTVRGANKSLFSEGTTAETPNNGGGYLDAFVTDGFSVTSGGSGDAAVNDNGATYVAWNWKAGGSAVSNTRRLHHF